MLFRSPDMRAVFMEPLACCLRALDRVSLAEEDTAVIIGAGAVGILFMPLLRDAKVKSLVIETRPERLALARKWGATDGCIVGERDVSDFAKQHTQGRGADLIILSVVNPTTLESALRAVRDGGTILIFGSKPKNEFALDWWDVWRREINLISSYSATPDLMLRAMALLAREDYQLESLITHQISLQNAQTGFDLVHQGKAGKVVITSHSAKLK